MKRSALLIAAFSAVLTFAVPFAGGSGPSVLGTDSARADALVAPVIATQEVPASDATTAASNIAIATAPSDERQANLAPKQEVSAETTVAAPQSIAVSPAGVAIATAERRAAAAAAGVGCPELVSGNSGTAPARIAGGGLISGTSSADMESFATQYNAIRVANCLQPVPMANFHYDSCMEDRLIWMAEDPSDDPLSAWGHIGSVRSDGVPSVGCDGNLAGGDGDTGASVADKWWGSSAHRESLYSPAFAGATPGVCIYFAATHGGTGTTYNEPASFTRAAARWAAC